jgi:hypothetical protein
MPGRTLQEQIEQLEDKIRREAEPDLREIQLRALEHYYKVAIMPPPPPPKPEIKYIVLVLVAYCIIAFTVILSFYLFPVYAAVCVIIGMFALLCLMMGVMLRMYGDISSNDLLTLVREGFKALFLLRKGPNQTGGNSQNGADDEPDEPNNPPS